MPAPKRSSNKPNKSQSQLRIIGGQWRGRKLAIADVDGLRPTGDRIRETVFNWLMGDIAGSCCIDLFAGSGALGLECLSRGAKDVTLLEQHPRAAEQLKAHCQLLEAEHGRVVMCDSLSWLNNYPGEPHCVDIVFIDPPFAAHLWDMAIAALDRSNMLRDKASIYIETPRNLSVNVPSHWTLRKEKQIGQVCYRLFDYALPTNSTPE